MDCRCRRYCQHFLQVQEMVKVSEVELLSAHRLMLLECLSHYLSRHLSRRSEAS